MPLTKADIADTVYKKFGFTKTQSATLVETLLERVIIESCV